MGGRGGQLFSGGFEKIPGGGKNFAGGLPPPGSNIPISSGGGGSVPPTHAIFYWGFLYFGEGSREHHFTVYARAKSRDDEELLQKNHAANFWRSLSSRGEKRTHKKDMHSKRYVGNQ